MERLALAITCCLASLVVGASSSSSSSTLFPPFSASALLQLQPQCLPTTSIHSDGSNATYTIEENKNDDITTESPTPLAISILYAAIMKLALTTSVASSSNTSSSRRHNNINSYDNHYDHFKPGSIVEIYQEDSYLATPAIIIDSSTFGSDGAAITVQNVVTNTRSTIPIPSSSSSTSSTQIHPYTPYTNGTRAYCNISQPNSNTVELHPCVVNSHTVRDYSGVVVYDVSYLKNVENEEEEELLVNEKNLPFSRVQRRRRRML